jgi:transposase
MARRINVKLILELREAGMSRNMIAATRHISKLSVSDVIHKADGMPVSYRDVKDKSDDEVYGMFYPDKHRFEKLYEDPDYGHVHSELKRTGVTLKLLWEEYRVQCGLKGTLPMGYSKYCEGYAAHTAKNSLTSHLVHKPGIAVEVDWSGTGMEFADTATGELVKVCLFVATLPFSQYSYVEPCMDMKEDTWLKCHVNMFEFFDGSTVRIVCDNLKTGVVKHPKEGDIILNDGYEALGSHYLAAIMPTGVRKPKQKASVEGTAGKVATAIIAKLRDERFFSFHELRLSVIKAPDAFNRAPFQKREGSRAEAFFNEEQAHLRGLPAAAFEIAKWQYGRSVNFDCHVVYAKNRYSCPYKYVGKKVDVKVTDSTLEVFFGSERIATHVKLPGYVSYKWSTHAEDMPDRFQKPEWDDERIRKWAHSIGASAGEAIDRIFESVQVKEQGYNSALSVLRLSKTYSEARLEAACELALTKIRTPRYHHLKSILSANQDQIYSSRRPEATESGMQAGYVRGASYYGGKDGDE